MLLTLSGMVTLVRPESRNALGPIWVTLSGIVMPPRFPHWANALLPMLVTPLGIVMPPKAEQLKNTSLPI